jgi:hypothetical protein
MGFDFNKDSNKIRIKIYTHWTHFLGVILQSLNIISLHFHLVVLWNTKALQIFNQCSFIS